MHVCVFPVLVQNCVNVSVKSSTIHASHNGMERKPFYKREPKDSERLIQFHTPLSLANLPLLCYIQLPYFSRMAKTTERKTILSIHLVNDISNEKRVKNSPLHSFMYIFQPQFLRLGERERKKVKSGVNKIFIRAEKMQLVDMQCALYFNVTIARLYLQVSLNTLSYPLVTCTC